MRSSVSLPMAVMGVFFVGATSVLQADSSFWQNIQPQPSPTGEPKTYFSPSPKSEPNPSPAPEASPNPFDIQDQLHDSQYLMTLGVNDLLRIRNAGSMDSLPTAIRSNLWGSNFNWLQDAANQRLQEILRQYPL